MQKITYSQVGDYLLPDIVLSDPPEAEPLTKYGMMRKNFIKQHKPILYSRLLLSERLYPHCRDVQYLAENWLADMMRQLVRRDPPPDKSENGLAWAAHMNTLHNIVEETILSKLVFDDSNFHP